MKTKSTLTSFQKNNKVKALTAKQKRKVTGGDMLTPLSFFRAQPEDGDSELLTPLSFFRCVR